jgi:hypothetical protein
MPPGWDGRNAFQNGEDSSSGASAPSIPSSVAQQGATPGATGGGAGGGGASPATGSGSAPGSRVPDIVIDDDGRMRMNNPSPAAWDFVVGQQLAYGPGLDAPQDAYDHNSPENPRVADLDEQGWNDYAGLDENGQLPEPVAQADLDRVNNRPELQGFPPETAHPDTSYWPRGLADRFARSRKRLSPEGYRQSFANIKKNQLKGMGAEEEVIHALGGDRNNRKGGVRFPGTDPDFIGKRNGSAWVGPQDVGDVKGVNNKRGVLREKPLQARAQRKAARAGNGQRVLGLHSDKGLKNGMPQVTPNRKAGAQDRVLYFDKPTGKVTHEWNNQTRQWEDAERHRGRWQGLGSTEGGGAQGGTNNRPPTGGASASGNAGEGNPPQDAVSRPESTGGSDRKASQRPSRSAGATSGEPSIDETKTGTRGPTSTNRSTQVRRGTGITAGAGATGSLFSDGFDNVNPESPPSSFVGPRAGTQGSQSMSVGADGVSGEFTREASAGLYAEKNGGVEGEFGSASYQAQAKLEAKAEVNGSGTINANGVDMRLRAGASVSAEASVRGRAETKSVTVGGVDCNASVDGGARVAAEATAEVEGGVQVTRNPPVAIMEGSAGASAVLKAECDITASAGPFSVSASGYGSAGAEARAEGAIGYRNGKVVLKGGLGAALGLGLGGDVGVEVDVKQLGTMAINGAAEVPGAKQVARATAKEAKAFVNDAKKVTHTTVKKTKAAANNVKRVAHATTTEAKAAVKEVKQVGKATVAGAKVAVNEVKQVGQATVAGAKVAVNEVKQVGQATANKVNEAAGGVKSFASGAKKKVVGWFT